MLPNIKLAVLFFLCSTTLFSTTIIKKPGEKLVYVDGIYDLAHFGHAASFEKAKQYAAKFFKLPKSKIKLLVGINDGDLKKYKREPVMSVEQRAREVEAMKGVDAVIYPASLKTSNTFIDKEGIDLVMHGDDYTQAKINKFYNDPNKRGIFKMYPYEKGISTTKLIRRATTLTLESLLEQSTNETDKKILSQAIKLVKNSKKI